MEGGIPRSLDGWDIHGFHTLEDLDIVKMKEEALTRWLRPNEIYAILCNHMCFKINVKPVELPQSGAIILYDRKMLRNFRKDGHNWKKKKDGKTVKEAHEHLKVGNLDRIHVYYAHGQDSPNFVRRIYWLLDKKLEHIVLVHYREVSEDNVTSYLTTPKECKEALSLSNRMHHGSPSHTPVNSHSGSFHSEISGSRVLSEEIDSGTDRAFHAGSGTSLVGESTEFGSQLDESLIVMDHEQRLHEINTLDWADLLETNSYPDSAQPRNADISCFDQQRPYGSSDSRSHQDRFLLSFALGNTSITGNGSGSCGASQPNNAYFQPAGDQNVQPSLLETIDANLPKRETGMATTGAVEISEVLHKNSLQSQDSLTRWMDIIENDSPGSLDELPMECPISTVSGSGETMVMNQSPLQEAFSITEVSPAWAFSTEETKIIVIGYFHEAHAYLAESNLFCVFGDTCVPAERIQVGVFRCMALPCRAGLVDFYLSLDGHGPISQVLSFEYRPVATSHMNNEIGLLEDEKSKWGDLQLQIRLAHLLFSTTSGVTNLCNVSPDALKEAKKFSVLTPSYEKDWTNFVNLIMSKEISFAQANQSFFELTLKNKLQEWILERVAEGCKTKPRDRKGQGVIHLCAMLGYAWAVYPFSLSGLSIDFRDANGWTALHWAAYYGREQMVAFLLSAGANPSLVTDPNRKCPAGYTAADLASIKGYDGLAAYLAEKGLTAHFNAMCISGNVSGSLQTTTTTAEQSENLNEEEQLMRDSLAAYRSAADAAARIQTALREHSLKVRTQVVQLENAETEALNIVSAMKIQHAYRNYHSRKRMAAAVRIQHRFRTWKIRRDFLNMRRKAIRIQAVFRGLLVRRQYRKILWSVGVLEKAILRWRQKRKGLRGLQAEPDTGCGAEEAQEDDGEEDFYQISRKQAEERVERSVVRVQSMFRSHQAQKEYRRMKLAFDQAKSEYEGFVGYTQQQ